MEIDCLQRNDTFKLQITLIVIRHKARPRLNYYVLPDPLIFVTIYLQYLCKSRAKSLLQTTAENLFMPVEYKKNPSNQSHGHILERHTPNRFTSIRASCELKQPPHPIKIEDNNGRRIGPGRILSLLTAETAIFFTSTI
jgi:hypothetical protein